MSDPKPRGRPVERLHAIVRFKVGLSSPTADHEVVWPKGWPTPHQNDQVFIGGQSGFVTHLTYDLEANRLIVNCR